MSDRVGQILVDLDRLRENLTALSDDMWLHIDHHDPEAFRQGTELMQSYHEVAARFTETSSDVRDLLRRAEVLIGRPIIAGQHIWDGRTPHGLDESFTGTKPFGFTLRGRDYVDVRTWRSVYERVCEQLAALDPERFPLIAREQRLKDHRGKPMLSADPSLFNDAYLIVDGVYTEMAVSATYICRRIGLLLREFGVRPQEMTIYLV